MRTLLVATWAAITEDASPEEAERAWDQFIAASTPAEQRTVRTRLAGGLR